MAASKQSAGILLFRRTEGLEVLIGHLGGPYFAKRDKGGWTIPKGEYTDDEAPYDAAVREFTEELGLPVPAGLPVSLGDVVQGSGKRVTIWAVEADLEPADVRPGTFTMEWPPRSGRPVEFPELDRVQWFPVERARPLVVAGQDAFFDRLISVISM